MSTTIEVTKGDIVKVLNRGKGSNAYVTTTLGDEFVVLGLHGKEVTLNKNDEGKTWEPL